MFKYLKHPVFFIYMSSLFGCVLNYLALPALLRFNKEHFNILAMLLSVMAIYVSYDLSANSILGKGSDGQNNSKFISNILKYIFYTVLTSIIFSFYFINSMKIESLFMKVVIVLISTIFNISQIISHSLNGLKLNFQSSVVNICGSIFRVMVIAYDILYKFDIYLFIIFIGVSYFLELILNLILIRTLLLKKISKFIYSRSLYLLKIDCLKFIKNGIYLSGGAVISQLDKVILLGRLDPQDYSNYFLLIVFSQFPLIAQYPLQRYLLPRYKILNEKKIKSIIPYFTIYVIFWIIYIYLSPTLIKIWAGSNFNIDKYLIWLAVIGTAFHSVYSYFQGYLIANEKFHLIATLNIPIIFLSLILLFLCNPILSGPLYWFFIGTIQILFSLFIIYNARFK